MKQIKRVWHDDGAHAWLSVRFKELIDLGIEDKISSYSYQYEDNVYLEEDCDAPIYLKTCKANNIEVDVEYLFTDDGDSFIRGLPSYNKQGGSI